VRFSAPVQTGPGAHPASCTKGTRSFPVVKYGRGMLLTSHPLLVPRSWKSRAITLPTLWATRRPVTGTLLPFYITFSTLPYFVADTFGLTNMVKVKVCFRNTLKVRRNIFQELRSSRNPTRLLRGN